MSERCGVETIPSRQSREGDRSEEEAGSREGLFKVGGVLNVLSAVGEEPGENWEAQEKREMVNERRWETEQRADAEGLDLGKEERHLLWDRSER